ncbi:hypothetical protein C8R47DRAFT_1147693 [Mycena vitilis]|nr:hypothetical protein C8R47DRAFT_1147693 [Mycena vitilis]
MDQRAPPANLQLASSSTTESNGARQDRCQVEHEYLTDGLERDRDFYFEKGRIRTACLCYSGDGRTVYFTPRRRSVSLHICGSPYRTLWSSCPSPLLFAFLVLASWLACMHGLFPVSRPWRSICSSACLAPSTTRRAYPWRTLSSSVTSSNPIHSLALYVWLRICLKSLTPSRVDVLTRGIPCRRRHVQPPLIPSSSSYWSARRVIFAVCPRGWIGEIRVVRGLCGLGPATPFIPAAHGSVAICPVNAPVMSVSLPYGTVFYSMSVARSVDIRLSNGSHPSIVCGSMFRSLVRKSPVRSRPEPCLVDSIFVVLFSPGLSHSHRYSLADYVVWRSFA